MIRQLKKKKVQQQTSSTSFGLLHLHWTKTNSYTKKMLNHGDVYFCCEHKKNISATYRAYIWCESSVIPAFPHVTCFKSINSYIVVSSCCSITCYPGKLHWRSWVLLNSQTWTSSPIYQPLSFLLVQALRSLFFPVFAGCRGMSRHAVWATGISSWKEGEEDRRDGAGSRTALLHGGHRGGQLEPEDLLDVFSWPADTLLVLCAVWKILISAGHRKPSSCHRCTESNWNKDPGQPAGWFMKTAVGKMNNCYT